MKTLIDISDKVVKTLAQICHTANISRAEAIRRAVADYIERHISVESAEKSAFGLWKSRGVDALAYEDNLRKEWGS